MSSLIKNLSGRETPRCRLCARGWRFAYVDKAQLQPTKLSCYTIRVTTVSYTVICNCMLTMSDPFEI